MGWWVMTCLHGWMWFAGPRNIEWLVWVNVSPQSDFFCISHPASGRRITLPPSAVRKYRLLLFDAWRSYFIYILHFMFSLMFFPIIPATYLGKKRATFLLWRQREQRVWTERCSSNPRCHVRVRVCLHNPLSGHFVTASISDIATYFPHMWILMVHHGGITWLDPDVDGEKTWKVLCVWRLASRSSRLGPWRQSSSHHHVCRLTPDLEGL